MKQLYFYALFFALVLPLVAGAADAGKAPLPHLGFYEKNSAEIPSAVREKLRFIYQFKAPYFTSVKQEYYAKLLDNPKLQPEQREDLQRCIDARLPVCVFHFAQISGTAFLSQDGQHIWTNCHMIHEWMEYEKQRLLLAGTRKKDLLQGIRSAAIPFDLYDTEGKHIFPLQTAEQGTLEAAKFNSLLTPKDLECSMATDAVKIKLSHPLAAAGLEFPPEKELTTLGRMVYVGGFPMPTKSRAEYGVQDSDGKSFYWTSGRLLHKGKEMDDYFGKDNHYDLAFAGPYSLGILSDGVEGMSGGPVLNEAGKVLGIFKGLLPLDKDHKDVPTATIIVTIEGMRFVEIFSEDL